MTIRHNNRRGRVSIAGVAAAVLVAGLAALAQARSAAAAGIVGDGTPGSCTDSTIQDAFDSGNGTITFNCGAAPITIDMATKVVGSGGVYTLDGNNKITLDGNDLVQLFIVSNGGDLTLRNLTLTNAGNFDGAAARVATNGSLTLRNVTIQDSGADVDRGGAIYNEGLLEIELSTFRDNQADLAGGALYNAAGATASVSKSYFVSNDAFDPVATLGDGGAIYNLGALTLQTSTLNQNDAKRHGGGIFTQGGSLAITNATIMENTAGPSGRGGGIYVGAASTVTLLNVTVERNNGDTAGAIWNTGGGMTIKNTIIANSSTSADNGVPSLNCDGATVISQGHNVIGDNTCVDGSNATDQRSTNPNLSFINDNGGPTDTLMPLPGSPVIDRGDNSGCPTTDQRGARRPAGSACDVGAIEYGLAVDANGNALSFLPVVGGE